MKIIDTSISEHIQIVNSLDSIKKDIETLAKKAVETLKGGRKILIMGNGGSAADSQHFAAEIAVRYKMNRRALPAIALTTDTSILTAAGNDYSFDMIFSRQIEALASADDLVVGISTSGMSKNITNGIKTARKLKCITSGLLGCEGGDIKDIVDIPVTIPSSNIARVQECHILIIHIICEFIDGEFDES
ncbi:MAG: SIS domain-containing protein [Spirochaetes bacterium]|nr:SIS domain-containing protein [Spirochaetota bacterium]